MRPTLGYPLDVLSVRSLRKSFGSIRAVEDVSFEVAPGSSFGLLGPNGAGKTTLISMIVGATTPDAGQILFEGQPLSAAIKRTVGYVPQEIALYDELSALDNLRFFGALYGLSHDGLKGATDSALRLAGLTDRADDKVGDYSGGMKRRLNIAAALLHQPKLLVLDEPTVGVDPQSRNAIFEALEGLRREGMTILYTTHYMEEVERLCDRVAVMDNGKLIAEDTLAGFQRLLPADNRVTIELDAPLSGLTGLDGAMSVNVEGTKLTVDLDSLTRDLPRVLAALQSKGLAYVSVESHKSSLEQIFLSLTGKALRD